MSALGVLVLAAILLVLGGAGALTPFFRRGGVPDIEVPPDPFDERRMSLLLSIKDLEVARASGDLEEQEYEKLRLETEARLIRVLKIIEERSKDGLVTSAGAKQRDSRWGSIPRWAGAVFVTVSILAVTTAGLVRSMTDRPEGATFTGSFSESAGSGGGKTPLAFFEARVQANPRDVAARLDLAHRYLDAGRVGEAIQEYTSALDLDPNNAEAHAHMGLLLYMTGRTDSALKAVERALSADPRYPEALFFKGVILLKGLNQPAPAREALQMYLELAPFGAEIEKARQYIKEAEASANGK